MSLRILGEQPGHDRAVVRRGGMQIVMEAKAEHPPGNPALAGKTSVVSSES
ncbi:hypothetical protein [Devosia sp. Root436]|uniref:hypothetical protein n=1 Tax=Devosia sp. Root436 TaxID=1736537 RepID=UPI001FCD0D70|nr:hypothetical protein [Devosia sp. Root436]